MNNLVKSIIVENPTSPNQKIDVLPFFDLINSNYSSINELIHSINKMIAETFMMASNDFQLRTVQEEVMPLVHLRDALKKMRQ